MRTATQVNNANPRRYAPGGGGRHWEDIMDDKPALNELPALLAEELARIDGLNPVTGGTKHWGRE